MSEQNPFWQDLNGAVFGEQIAPYQVTGQGHRPSFYCTSDLAEASIGLAGTALAQHRCARVSEGAIVQSFEDFDPKRKTTGWVSALRVKAPMDVSGQAMEWALGAGPLRRHDPHWS